MRHELEVEVLLDGEAVTRGVMLDEGFGPDRSRYAWVYLNSTGRKAWVPMRQVRFGERVPAPRGADSFAHGTHRY